VAHLIRDRDGEGDSGPRVEALDPETREVVGHEPTVGYCLLVGSLTASSFGNRDHWVTTPVTEIISDSEDEVRFKTGNSVYTLKR
jgi:hypothetical protein